MAREGRSRRMSPRACAAACRDCVRAAREEGMDDCAVMCEACAELCEAA